MSTHFHDQVKNMTRDRQARILEQSTETVAEAQAALEQAQASHDRYPNSRKAYRLGQAHDRVAAAKCRSDDLVMAWVEAYALEINAVRKFAVANHNFQAGKCEYPRNLESVAYHAEQAAILAWQAVRSQRDAQRAKGQVEALRPVAARLMCAELRQEWQAAGGI